VPEMTFKVHSRSLTLTSLTNHIMISMVIHSYHEL